MEIKLTQEQQLALIINSFQKTRELSKKYNLRFSDKIHRIVYIFLKADFECVEDDEFQNMFNRIINKMKKAKNQEARKRLAEDLEAALYILHYIYSEDDELMDEWMADNYNDLIFKLEDFFETEEFKTF